MVKIQPTAPVLPALASRAFSRSNFLLLLAATLDQNLISSSFHRHIRKNGVAKKGKQKGGQEG